MAIQLRARRRAEERGARGRRQQGHGEFTGMMLGSVSEYLASYAQRPIVIVRHCTAPY